MEKNAAKTLNMAQTIYIDQHCGERMVGSDKEPKNYCARCKSADGRKKVDEENAEIRKELASRAGEENINK